MIIAWENKLDAATITSVGSQISTLPATNVQNAHLSKKWYTAAAVNSSFFVFDFGASTSLSMLAVLGTNLTATATYRLRQSANSDGVTSPVYDSGTVTASVKTGYGAIYKQHGPASARYGRLDITDASLTQLQIGRVFLGPHWTPSINELFGWSVTPMDESEVHESYGKQSHPDVRPKRRLLSFTLDYMDEAEMYTNAFKAQADNGVVKDVLAIPDLTSSYVSEQSVYGLLSVSQPLVHRTFKAFRQEFRIKERL
jgi:hypothetical protein